jgi:anti-sigma-K factor RskA
VNEHLEELAALQAAGLLDEAGIKALLDASERDPEVQRVIDAFAETAALLAYAAPQEDPPPALKRELLRELPRHRPEPARIVSFWQWIPYALAACLMGLAIWQAHLISGLKVRLQSVRGELAALQERNDLAELRLTTLAAKDPAYVSATIMVAWDPQLHHGVITMQNLPPPPAGHDYQLWVLDPTEPAPVNAGLIKFDAGSDAFAVHPVSTTGPGFAISLEPSGGGPTPTGAILFAVAPGS